MKSNFKTFVLVLCLSLYHISPTYGSAAADKADADDDTPAAPKPGHYVLFGKEIPTDSFMRVLGTFGTQADAPENSRLNFFTSFFGKKADESKGFFTRDEAIVAFANEWFQTGAQAIPRAHLAEVYFCMHSGATSYWQDHAAEALSNRDDAEIAELQAMFKGKMDPEVMNSALDLFQGYNARMEPTTDTTPKPVEFPTHYPCKLRTFFETCADQTEQIMENMVVLGYNMVMAKDDAERARVQSMLDFWSLRLHAANHPHDIFFDNLVAKRLMPSIPEEGRTEPDIKTDREFVRDLIFARIGFEQVKLHQLTRGDRTTTIVVRLVNFTQLKTDMLRAGANALQARRDPLSKYMAVRQVYHNALTQIEDGSTATWANFRQLFRAFYDQFTGKDYGISPATFLEHERIGDTDLVRLVIAPAEASSARRRAAVDTATRAVDTALSQIGPDASEADVAHAQKVQELMGLLQAAQAAQEAGNIKEALRLMQQWEAKKQDLAADDAGAGASHTDE